MNIQSIGQSYAAYSSMSSIMQGAQGTQESFKPPEMDADTIMENEDVNGDGVLTIDETQLTEEMFADADTDSDGELSMSELEAKLESMGPPPGMGGMAGGGGMPPEPPDADAIFEIEDVDGDGMISAEESALSSEMFSEIDADQDGYITAEELEEHMAANAPETGQSSDISTYQQMNREQVLTAYQNAINSFMNFEMQDDTFLSSGAYQGIFA